MTLNVRRFADTLVLSPAGRLDYETANTFRQALLDHLAECAAGRNQIVVDLSGVEYISSVGLRALMVASKQAKTQNATLVLAGLQPLVREIFDISKFSLVFPIHHGVREALAEVSPPALAAFEAA